MITVVHLITGLGTGGAERMLLKVLRASGHGALRHVVVSLTDEGSIGPRIRREAGIELHALGMPRGFPDPRAVARLRRLLGAIRPDLLMTWLYHADLLGLLAGRWAGVPRIVWNLRCSVMQSGGRSLGLVKWLLARLSGWPDAVLVNSQAGKDYHQSLGYRPRLWRRIPNGFDLDAFRPDPAARSDVRRELGVSEETPLVGLVARFDGMKDHGGFLQAAAAVLKQMDGVHFLLAGDDVTPGNPFFSKRVFELGLSEHIHLLGRRDDIARLNAALDVAASTSIGEGFSNTLGEALACGVPCVATDVGDSAWIIGEAGRIAPPSNPEAFAEAILALLQMAPVALRRLGEQGRARMEANFSLEAVVGLYHTFYREMMDAPGKARR